MSGELLLNPGPVTLTRRVRNALAGPDLCHRETEFFDLQDELRARLLSVYGLDEQFWVPAVLSGSGTAAVEAMIASLPGDSDRLLVIENGVYGERMRRMAEIHGIDHVRLTLDWGQAIPLDELSTLIEDRAVTHVALVHHETTTGRLNDLAGVAGCCERANAQLLVDAVSSFGAEAIDFSPCVAAVAATANKCLHGAPGVAFVIARRQALEQARTRSLYLDLAGYAAKQEERGTPFTPAIPAFHGLVEALAEHAEAGGWPARQAHYRQLADQVANGLAEFDIEPLLPAALSSVVLRAYRLPAGVGYARLHDHLKEAGFVIYAGQGRLAEDIFRISTMGDLTPADMERLMTAVAEIVVD